MICLACAAAQTDADHPIYFARCRGCRVRSLANGPAHFEAQQAGRITPAYKAALQKLAGEDWQAAHAEVKQERARIAALKDKQVTTKGWGL